MPEESAKEEAQETASTEASDEVGETSGTETVEAAAEEVEAEAVTDATEAVAEDGPPREVITEEQLNRELGSLTAVGPADNARLDTEAAMSPEPEEERASAPTPPPPAAGSTGAASFIPLLLGGIMAGLIGFLIARYMDETAVRTAEGPTPAENAAALAELSAALQSQGEAVAVQGSALAVQENRLSELTTGLEEISTRLGEVAARDVAGEIAAATEPLGTGLETARAETADRFDALGEELAAVSERVETIAMRPQAPTLDPEAFDEALRDFRSELRAAIGSAHAEIAAARQEAETIYSEAEAEFRTEFTAALEQARAEVAAAREEAAAVSEAAQRAERAAEARAAWSRVRTALDEGTPYAEPLGIAASALSLDVPEVVSGSAESGIPTLAALQDGYPEAARAALAASIRENTGEGAMDRLTAFMRVQSGVRSLEPREGDDPDAILSRAEAALRDGDVGAALAELDALPEAGQAAISGWRAGAETRVSALAAAAELAEQIEAN